MKYSETPEHLRASRIDYINERWGQLNGLFKDYSDNALKYLFLSNAGGAAAVLGFLGASSEVRDALGPRVSLSFFLLGLIATGVLNAVLVHRIDFIFEQWRKNVDRYFSDEITWQQLTREDDQISWGNIKEYSIGYMAFFSFVIGSLIGVAQFLC